MGTARPTPRVVVVPDGWVRPLRAVAVAAVALGLVAAGVAAVRSGPDLRPLAEQAPATSALLLSGSSLPYASGQQTARALGWDTSVYSLPGAGLSRSTLAADGRLVHTLGKLLAEASAPPDVVVVQGGEADHASTPERVERAAEHLIDYVEQHTRAGTRLVLVGPIPGGSLPPSLVAVNDVLERVAEERDVAYVDAIDLQWRVGDPAVPALLAVALSEATSSTA